MDKKKKVWLLDFCEVRLDGLTWCHRHGGSASGYRLLWERVGEKKAHPELDVPGIYFIVGKTPDSGRPHIYVGQAAKRTNQKAMLNRVKEHKRNGEFHWGDDVVFICVPGQFGPTELNYLENYFYQKIREAGRYDAGNANTPHRAQLRDEIYGYVEDVIEDVECILAIFGYRPFLAMSPASAATDDATRKTEQEKTSSRKKNTKISSTYAKKTNPSVGKNVAKKHAKLPPFTFSAVGIPVGATLRFTELPISVSVEDDRRVSYLGETFTTTGFVVRFMPDDKRNAKDAYQGPAYFTYNGRLLTDIRKDVLYNKKDGGADKQTAGMIWTGKTQLARLIAAQGGNVGAYGGILHLFNRRRPCVKGSKWRTALENAGIRFDADDKVISWEAAKNPL